jgi:hypothetical protein
MFPTEYYAQPNCRLSRLARSSRSAPENLPEYVAESLVLTYRQYWRHYVAMVFQ